MYWILDSERVTDDDGGYLEIDDLITIPDVDQDEWPLGHVLNLKLSPLLQIVARPRNAYVGPPPDFHYSRLCLMSERMVGVLRENGVDNLETYPTTVVNEATKERWPFLVVNVIGVLAVADMEQSEWESYQDPLLGETVFDRLVINERLCMGLPMFRLAQNKEMILISDRLRIPLEASGLSGFLCVDRSQPEATSPD